MVQQRVPSYQCYLVSFARRFECVVASQPRNLGNFSSCDDDHLDHASSQTAYVVDLVLMGVEEGEGSKNDRAVN